MFRVQLKKLAMLSLLIILASVAFAIASPKAHADGEPDTILISAPSTPSNSSGAAFEFESTIHSTDYDYDIFLCTLDGQPGSCFSPYVAFNLANGPHTLTISAQTDEGIEDPTPLSISWTVNTSLLPESIDNCDELQAINDDAQSRAGNYILSSDIDCDDITNFVPIGSPSIYQYGANAFIGMFDGNQHIVRNLHIDDQRPGNNGTGLFGYNVGTIHHVGVVGGLVQGHTLVGGLIGQNGGSVDYTFSDITVQADGAYVGGLIGQSFGNNVNHSYALGDVSGSSAVGGFVGRNWGQIYNSYTGDQTVTGTGEYIGGFMGTTGQNSSGMTNIASIAHVVGPSPGGIAGFVESASPETWHWDGTTSGLNCAAPDSFVGADPSECNNHPGDRAYFLDMDNQPYASFVGSGLYQDNSAMNKTPTFVWHDLTTPTFNTTIGDKPASASANPIGTFTFSGTQPLSFECSVDDSAFAECSSPYATSELADGMHVFKVRGKDINDFTDPTPDSYSWLIDTTAPDTEILSQPTDPDLSPTGVFEFSGNEMPSTFECSVDDAEFEACTSPFTTDALSNGLHSFDVRAIDGIGNEDQSPAHVRWRVGPVPPPIYVHNCDELGSIVMTVNSLSLDYILANNIDCDGQEYLPVGDDQAAFTGSLDGQGYSILNVDIVGGGHASGIFGYATGAEISNLHVNNVHVTGGGDTGAIIGNADGVTLTDVYVEGASLSGTNVGGLIGRSGHGPIFIDGSYSGALTIGFNSGGLIGRFEGELIITNSYADGTVNGHDTGGLIGDAEGDDLYIESSYSAVSMPSGDYGGGLIGWGSVRTNIVNSFSASTHSGGVNYGGISYLIPGDDSSYTNVHYTDTEEGCTAGGDVIDGCSWEGGDPDYFLGGDGVNAPLDTWDDDGGFWNVSEWDELPTFEVGVAECDAPSSTSTTISFRCEFQREMKHRYTGEQVTGEYRWRRAAGYEWHYGDIDEDGNVDISNLQPNTMYVIGVHADWEINSTDWNDYDNRIFYSTAVGADFDFDHDGIVDIIEDAAPNGDANGSYYDDGIVIGGADKTEANVTSFVNPVTGYYSAVETDCNQNGNVSASAEPTDPADSGYDYSLGLISFTATGCDELVTVTQYFYGGYNAGDYTARKYNSDNDTYTTIPGAVFSNVTINDQKVLKLVYQITDNGLLDQDPTDGAISDPAGPGTAIVGAPNTGLGN